MALNIVGRILIELGFFTFLVACSEGVRIILRRRAPHRKGLRKGFLVCSLVLSWYSISITLVLFNKWILTAWQDGGLPFPIFYTTSHMFLKGVFAFTYICCIRCRPLPQGSPRILLGTALIGMLTGIDVAASNQSFLYITVTFYTMLKSASLIFFLFLGVVTRIEAFSIKIWGAVSFIALGICMSSAGEARFNATGFGLVISSEFAAAARWLLTQVILHGGELAPMSAVLMMSPAATFTLLPLAIVRERNELATLMRIDVAVRYFLIVLFPGFLAFLLLLVEVQLVKVTSGLTMGVFGNLKSVVTIVFAILVFHEEASPLQWFGLVVALFGMFAYSYIKKKKTANLQATASAGFVKFDIEDEEDREYVFPWDDPSDDDGEDIFPWEEWGFESEVSNRMQGDNAAPRVVHLEIEHTAFDEPSPPVLEPELGAAPVLAATADGTSNSLEPGDAGTRRPQVIGLPDDGQVYSKSG